jgi:hypothetical protein
LGKDKETEKEGKRRRCVSVLFNKRGTLQAGRLRVLDPMR